MKIQRFQTLFGTFRYIDHLKKIVNEYNNTIHSKTKMTPNSVTKSDEKRLLNTVYKTTHNSNKKSKQRFKIGDAVRISRIKHLFEKAHKPNWSFEIFNVVKVQHTKPVSYILRDYHENVIAGCFYNEVSYLIFVVVGSKY